MEKMESVVGNLLRGGVVLSAAVALAGGVAYLFRHGAETPAFHVFRGEPSDLRSLRGIFSDALSWRVRGIIQLGVLLLIATPVARVAYLVYAFARQRDRLYAAFSLIVLLLLAYGLAGGRI
jgi:uncharacterized membrane protein